MKKINIAIIIIFIIFITLPTILFYFFKNSVDTENHELTPLLEKPSFNLKTISEFSSKYEEYYNDYLPFKNQILNYRGLFYLHALHSTSSALVILGKNNWLFYSNPAQLDNPISDFQNFSYYSKNDSEIIKNKLLDTKQYLSSQNTDFYILVLPNKENVYSDYIPEIIKQNPNRKLSRTEILLYSLKSNTDLKIVYPKKELVDERKICDTYFKNDTHWNNYGAYLGTKALMKTIDTNFFVESSSMYFEKDENFKDLARFNNLFYIDSSNVIINDFFNNSNCELIESEDNKCQTTYNSNAPYNKTMVLIGDSYSGLMIKYLSKLYTKFIFINRNYCTPEIFEQYDPDIVVYECVERFSYELGNIDNYIGN